MKVAPYDASIRSPLIVSMPSRLPQGEVCDTPVAGPDLIPTFFEFAEINTPWPMHGRSIGPLLREPRQAAKRKALVTFTGRAYGSDTDRIPVDPQVLMKVSEVPWYASLHDGRFKYIRTFVEGELEELYDLQVDPEELRNLARQPDQRDRVLEMRREMIAELRRTDAGFVDHLPSVAALP